MASDNRRDFRFMPDTSAMEVETLPITLHLILWLTLAFLLVALVWANLAKLDEVAHADGRVIPSSQVQIIQNLEGGILSEVLCRQGEQVVKGQVLLRIDDTRFSSSFNEGRMNSHALMALTSRLQAEVDEVPFTIPADAPTEALDYFNNEVELYRARQRELRSNLDILDQQLNQQQQSYAELRAEETKLSKNAQLVQEELNMTEPLVKTGAVSQVELIRLQMAVNESRGRLEVTRSTLEKARSVITEAEQKIDGQRRKFNSDARAQLNEAKTELNRLTFANVALEDRVQRTEVRSPVDGTIKQILVSTVGGIIQPGMDLLEIVPTNDSLLIEAKIRPSDIAFIRPGQKATVKLTAYDYAIYGGLESTLELISADTITDERGEHYFQIQVRTNKTYLGSEDNQMPIMPGMIASVDILTGEKTVMDYLLKPLKRAQASALRER